MVYDSTSRRWDNNAGVLTRVPGFGDTSRIEALDTNGIVKYFKPLVDQLVDIGYERGASIRGAPFDWR